MAASAFKLTSPGMTTRYAVRINGGKIRMCREGHEDKPFEAPEQDLRDYIESDDWSVKPISIGESPL